MIVARSDLEGRAPSRVERAAALFLAAQLVAVVVFAWSHSVAAAMAGGSPPSAPPPTVAPPYHPEFGDDFGPFAPYLDAAADARDAAPDLVLFFTGSNRTARHYGAWASPRASPAHVLLVDSLWNVDECLLLSASLLALSPRRVVLAGHSTGAMRALHTASRCPTPERAAPLSLLLLALPGQFMRQPATLPSSLPTDARVVMATGELDCERPASRLPPCGEARARAGTCVRLVVRGGTHAGWADVRPPPHDVPASDAATMPRCASRLPPAEQQAVGAALVSALLNADADATTVRRALGTVWDVAYELGEGKAGTHAAQGRAAALECSCANEDEDGVMSLEGPTYQPL